MVLGNFCSPYLPVDSYTSIGRDTIHNIPSNFTNYIHICSARFECATMFHDKSASSIFRINLLYH